MKHVKGGAKRAAPRAVWGDRACNRSLLFALTALTPAGFTGAAAINQIATWTGGAGNGNWSSAGNWSPQTVPANDANDLYNVIVGNGVNLNFDLSTPTTINGISDGSGGSINLAGGAQLTIANIAALNSNIIASGANTLFTATGIGVNLANDVQLSASGGATIAVGAASYTFDANAIETAWSADGTGSIINAASLNTITDNGSSQFANSQPTFSATNGGTIDLSGLQSLVGGSGYGNNGYASNYFIIGSGSNINLSNLGTMTQYNSFNIQAANYSLPSLQTAGGVTFTLAVGTTFSAPALTSVAGWSSSFNVPNSAIFNAPALTTLNDTTINISVGGTLNVPQLQNMEDSAISLQPGETFNYKPPTNFDNSRVYLTGGASFTIAATSYTYNRNAIETAWSADGTGSVINAASVGTLTNNGSSQFANSQPTFSATNGGTIDLSGLQSLVGGSGYGNNGYASNYFIIGSGSNINLSNLRTMTEYNSFNIQAANYSLPSLQTAGGVTFTLAIGTTVSAPALTSVAGWSSSFNISNFATFNAPALTTLNDATISIGVGGALNVPQLQTMQDSAISLQPGETFTYKAPTNFDNSRVSVAGGASFTIAATSYTYNRDAIETAWSADGNGSVINAASVGMLTNNGPSSFNFSQPTFSATNGGAIDLSGLQSLVGGVGSGFAGSASTSFVANSGGTIRFGRLTASQYNSFSADGSTTTLEFNELHLNAPGSLSATNLANIVLHGPFSFNTTSAASLNLDQGVVQFAADGRPTLEVAGFDNGTSTSGLGNFGISQLIVGSATKQAVLELVDNIDNGDRGGSGKEALYLLNVSGTGLRIQNGSTLVLDNLNAYSISGNHFINLNSLFGAGQTLVPYDGGYLAKTMTNIPTGWKVDADGDWSTASNWNVSSPNGIGAVAYFGPVITAPRTVNVDSPKTVGYIGFEGAQQYTIAGTNTLTLDAAISANIEVVSGIHEISAPVFLNKDTQVNVTGVNDSLRLDNVTAASQTTITKVGLGVLNMGPVGQANLAITAGSVNMIQSAADAATSFSSVDVSPGAKWNLISYDQTVGSLSDSGAIDLGFGRLTVQPGDAGSSFAGTITGSAGVLNAGLTVAGIVDANVPGSGILTLSGAATYQGDTNIVSGGLQFAAGNVAAVTSAFTVSAGASLNLADNSQTIGSLAGSGAVQLGIATLTLGGTDASTTFAGTITGTGGITKNGAGTFALTTANTFSGTTTINAGVVQLGNSLALQNSTAQINVNNGLDENTLAATIGGISGSGDLVISGASLTVGGNNVSTVYGGALSGPGELIKIGAGSLALRGNNSYAGGTLISGSGGVLDIDSDSRLGADGTTITMNNGYLYWDTGNPWTTSRPIVVSDGTGAIETDNAVVTLNGAISGAGTFVKTGNGEVVLNTPNTVAGMNIEAGQLELAVSGAAGTGTLAATNITPGATIVISKTSGAPTTVITNPIRLDLGATSIDFRVDNGFTLELDGPISGGSDFEKGTGGASGMGVGTGILALAGNNSAYTGTITVQTGTLSVQSATALGSAASGTRVSPGATLSFVGPLNYTPAEPIALAGTLSATGGATSFAGSVTLSGPSTINVDAGASFTTSSVNGSFSLTKTGSGTLTLTGSNPYTGNTAINAGVLTLAPLGVLSTPNVAVAFGATFNVEGTLNNLQTLIINSPDNTVQPGGTMIVGGPGTPTAIAFIGNQNPSLQLFASPTSPGQITLKSDVLFTGTAGTAGIYAAGSGALPGTLDLGAGTRTFTVTDGSAAVDMEVSARIIDGGISKSGTGVLLLSGVNTYSGGTTISDGMIAVNNASSLGAGMVTFAGGGLQFQSDAPSPSFAQPFSTLAGNSTTAGGSISLDIEPILNSTAGTFALSTVTLGSALSVTGSAGGTVTFTGMTLQNLTAGAHASPTSIHNAVNVIINGVINQTGANGDILKDGAGMLTFAGAGSNTYTGLTSISGGTLLLDKTSGTAVPGNLTVYGGGTVQLAASNQIATTSVITLDAVPSAAVLDLNGNSNTFGTGLSFVAGGTLMTGTGKATLGGDVQFTGTSGTATITGNLDLGIAGRTFTIARGSAAEDMQVSANVTGGPSTGTAITKAGSGILAFSGANSYAGNTTVSAGTLIFGASGAFPNGNSLTINAGTARVSNLINANKILLQASSLAFGGSTGAWTGQLDLTSNDMIIHNGVIANIANQLKTGFNVSSGYWNGPGGIVSTSAASDSTHLTTLGYRTGGTPLDGVNTTSSDVLLMYTYYGDADLNGTVNGADYQQIDLGFGQHLTGWSNGDFNYDGVVDGSDYSLIDNTYNQINATGASPLAIIADPSDLIANPADATAVPEPTNLGLLGISATGLLRRRGRRKT